MLPNETETTLLKVLYEQNPWWDTHNVPDQHIKSFRRDDFSELFESISEKKILAIVGPRQVGKTTSMYQMIDGFISNKVDPKKILYCSFDYPYLTSMSNMPINDILAVYAEKVLKAQISSSDAVYIFFDEICKLPDWSSVLKGWSDLKYNIKFVISDSSSAEVLRGSSESLVGRINLHIMQAMSFAEVARYFFGKPLSDKAGAMLPALEKAAKSQDPKEFYDAANNAHGQLMPHEGEIKLRLNEYLIKGGHPELLEQDFLKASERLKTYLSLTLYKDIVRMFEIRDPKTLDELVSLLAASSSQQVDYSSLSKTLGVKVDTLSKYLNLLESAFLISRSEFYSRSRASRIKKSKKVYLTNLGLRNASLGILNDSILDDGAELGKIAETAAFEHCKLIKSKIDQDLLPRLNYWKTKRGEEVDIVIELARKPIPIEVKYRNNIERADLKGITKFLEESSESREPGGFGIVITKDIMKLEDNMVFLPMWLFLMI